VNYSYLETDRKTKIIMKTHIRHFLDYYNNWESFIMKKTSTLLSIVKVEIEFICINYENLLLVNWKNNLFKNILEGVSILIII
jgi:hypothetical protein